MTVNNANGILVSSLINSHYVSSLMTVHEMLGSDNRPTVGIMSEYLTTTKFQVH